MKKLNLKTLSLALLCFLGVQSAWADGEVTTAEGLQTALTNASTDASNPTTITLGASITGTAASYSYDASTGATITPDFSIASGKYVVLDLHGYDITGSGNGPIFKNEGTLTIEDLTATGDPAKNVYSDSNTEGYKSGKITGGYKNKYTDATSTPMSGTYGGVVWNLGTLTIASGTFTGNYGRNGGAFGNYQETGVSYTITGGLICNNTSTNQGGAIATWSTTDITVSNAAFISNKAGTCGGAIYNCNGNITVNSGTFTGNSAKTGGATYANSETATTTIKGGTFTENTATTSGGAVHSNGDITIEDGTFTSNSAEYGGAIHSGENSPTTIKCGTFTQNTATLSGGAVYSHGDITIEDGTFTSNSAQYGGAIFSYANTTTTIKGGTFTSNSAQYGGATYYETNSTTTIKGGTFTGNAATKSGGALYSNGNVTIEAGTFTSNSATNGGAIFAPKNTNITTIKGGTFTGNYTSNSGFGVIYSGGVLCVSGNPVIKDNKVSSDEGAAASDIKQIVTLSGDITSGADIRFTTIGKVANNTGNYTIAGDATIAYSTYPSSEATTYKKDDGVYITLGGSETTTEAGGTCKIGSNYYATLTEAANAIFAGKTNDNKTIEVYKNMTMTQPAVFSDAVITANSAYTITADKSSTDIDAYHLITVDENGKLEVSGPITFEGGYYDYTHNQFLDAESGHDVANRNCIYVQHDGQLTMTGNANNHLAIKGFLAGATDHYNNNGSAICVYDRGTVQLTNCDFNYNKNSKTGGAIAFPSHGDGGTEVEYTLTMTNCNLCYNQASDPGGAIYCNGSYPTINATGCTFSNNTGSSGGAIYGYGDWTFSGCSFTGNKATSGSGGAIRKANGGETNPYYLTIIDTEISGNTATNGSAVHLDIYGNAYFTGGKISGTLYKLTSCVPVVTGGMYDTNANTGTATSTSAGQFKVSDFLATGYECIDNPYTDYSTTYPYFVRAKELAEEKPDVVLYDGAPYLQNVDATVKSVTYTRTVQNAFGTIVLPFVPVANDNVKYYTISSVNDGEGKLSLTEVTTPEVNKPYVFGLTGLTDDQKAADTYTMTLTANNTTLSAAPSDAMSNAMGETGFTMYGTYAQKTPTTGATNSIYYISGNKFLHATGTLTTNPYRAWLETSTTPGARAYSLVIGDETTGIATVENGNVEFNMGKIYDLQGRHISAPQRGNIYIVNGKKIMF